MTAAATPITAKSKSWHRAIAYRVLAVSVGLAPFALLETALWLGDVGRPSWQGDPFVGFGGSSRLFVHSEDRQKYEIPTSRQEYFRPASFDVEKPDGEFRIFCLGGSTVQGRPFAVETSFTTWLELSLGAADPRRQWKVVNCGGVSYASYRLASMMRELTDYEPDLFIIYTGHNEFLEDRTYESIKQLPRPLLDTLGFVGRSRIVGTLLSFRQPENLSGNASITKTVLPDEVEAMLDYEDGLAKYHRDDVWRVDITAHFRYSLRRMIGMAQEQGVPVLLINPVSSLRDCPPFKFSNRDDISRQQRDRFDALWQQAKSCGGDLEGLDRSRVLLQHAIAIDDRHAGVHYHLAECHIAIGDGSQAKAAYLRAKEEDLCPLRMLEPMHEALLQVARDTDVPVVDIRGLFENRSRDGIPGRQLLIDHVHPTIHGHQLICDALMDELVRQRVVEPRDGWKHDREQAYRAHLGSLDVVYFETGKERLKGLQSWAAGRSRKIRGTVEQASP